MSPFCIPNDDPCWDLDLQTDPWAIPFVMLPLFALNSVGAGLSESWSDELEHDSIACEASSKVRISYHNCCMKWRANGWFIYALISNSHFLTNVIWWLVSSQIAIARARIHMPDHGPRWFNWYLTLGTKVHWSTLHSMEISLPWCGWRQIGIANVS